MLLTDVVEEELIKLKADLLEVLRKCPTTNRGREDGEPAGCAAGAVRRLLPRDWRSVIRTNEDVAELARRCDELDVSPYPIGARSGLGTLYVIRYKKGRTIGQDATEARPGRLQKEAQKLFDFPVGTKKNIAAALYLSADGATTEQVTKLVGGHHLNLLKEVEKKGYIVRRDRAAVGSSGRRVIRYRIVT